MKVLSQLILFIALIFIKNNSYAQDITSLNREAEPKNGVVELALDFYSINFDEEQRSLLSEKDIELIFKIEKDGTPTLSKINGVSDASIQDSLKIKSLRLEPFHPKVVNNTAEESIYFLQLKYPSNKIIGTVNYLFSSLNFAQAKIEDFQHIEIDNEGTDMNIGLGFNNFVGKASTYNTYGGGLVMDFSYVSNKNYIYGLNLAVFGSSKLKDYPIQTYREQLKNRSTALMGLSFGKWYNNFNIQAEINYAVHNVTERIYDNDPDWIQFRGWSPGIMINYSLKVGKEKPILYYGIPSILTNNINFRGGLRYIQFSQKSASGLMFEVGVSYRLKIRKVNNFNLKQNI